MLLTTAGVAIISLAWLIRLLKTESGSHMSEQTFLLAYGIGTALLVAEATNFGANSLIWMHALTLLVVALLYLRTHHHHRK